MEHSKPVSTPMLKESTNIEKSDEQNSKRFPYREAVGALMYLMIGTRPDLAYCVGVLSRHLENPPTEDWMTVKRVLRYIAGSYDKGIVYKHKYKQGLLECYTDADFGGCKASGRSTSGIVILYSGGAISWFSQRQSVAATSTTEAEIIAANECCREIIWLKRLFSSVTKLDGISVLKVDNRAAIRLAQNPEFHRRTKHISIKHFFYQRKGVRKGITGAASINRRPDC
ncbi:Retrovirus-related Pol polyprotein from transposon TNT 1-94 [Araneus ventricosus]|uniref:Retrovirus-related Pol polyprotein from transposon TNT 1-94 n=1 Tax=Araneus ventricosus TaxID=182803 RepID=A0A4Y2V2G0_ARAVE|nr:Retrovirus-related Pol polyprotein from transposon TNT 1-94 [Araneus ventricosus]